MPTPAAAPHRARISPGFGAVTITRAITIQCEGVIAGIVASGTNGIIVNAPGAVVVLHGLDINGVGTGLAGINIICLSGPGP
jgi:nitrous oxidase accessory protein NosD